MSACRVHFNVVVSMQYSEYKMSTSQIGKTTHVHKPYIDHNMASLTSKTDMDIMNVSFST